MSHRRRKRQPQHGICAYCGIEGIVDEDHVPPKNVFAKPRPQDMIFVWACHECHHAGTVSMDDEYFRNCLCLNDDVRHHPDAEMNLQAALRSLQRPEAPGFAKAFLSQLFPVQLVTPSGLLVGTTLGYRPDFERILRVVERTVRGLYFKETGSILPCGHDILILTKESLAEAHPEGRELVEREAIAPLRRAPVRVVGANAFSYCYAMTERPPTSAWCLCFYGKIEFLALIGPENAKPQGSDGNSAP